MKKNLIFTLLSIFLTVGCTTDKIEQPIVSDQPTDESFQNTLPEVLYASISDDDSSQSLRDIKGRCSG